MALPSEDLVKCIWMAMWDVQAAARRDKVPGPLQDIGKTANRQFEYWFTHPGALHKFAKGVLCGAIDLRATTGQLPVATRDSCWRFLDLLESIDG
jgi:hypothetical protein